MSRTKKLLAVGALALGIVAAATSPALAHRHATGPASENRIASLGPEESRHATVVPMDGRHGA